MGDHEKEAEGGEWEWLPSDMLFLIFSCLPLSDLIRSALVCKRWRLSVVDVHHHRPTLPFLWSFQEHPGQLYSISDRRFYSLTLPPEINDSVAVDTIHEDWVGLLTYPDWNNDNNPMSYFLYNPFSGAIIQLPPVGPCPEWPNISPEIKFSCNPGEPGCQAAYFIRPSEGIGYCRRVGVDIQSHWEMIPCETWYRNIAFHNDLIYLVTYEGGLDIADPVSMATRSLLPPPTMKNIPFWLGLWVSLSKGISLGGFSIFSVKDELMMVCVIKGAQCAGGSPIAIYRADFAGGRWELLENLNGQVVLMESTHSLLSFTPDKMFGLEGNCVYVFGEKDAVRMFRVSRQTCGTFNLVQNGFEDGVLEVDEFRDGDDEQELLYPASFYDVFFHMLTPKPKFFIHS